MFNATHSLYQFGEFGLDPQARVLRKGREPVLLTPKAFDVLLLMVQNAGKTVSKDQLMESVWPNSFVEESNLTQTIFMVRRALDETSDRRYIMTVQGHGYRFVVPVTEESSVGAEAHVPIVSAPMSDGQSVLSSVPRKNSTWRKAAILGLIVGAFVLIAAPAFWRRHSTKAPAEQPGRITLAVLPFQNLTGDAGQEYFSDGLTEEMITQLGNLNPERLGVIARTSVMHYKDAHTPLDQIGRELNAQYVLEGSVRREQNRVRITAQLIQVRDQTHVWAREYDRQLDDLLGLEVDVAQEIAKEVRLTFDARREAGSQQAAQQESVEGYDLYLKGLYFFNKRTPGDLEEAIHYFQQAVAKAPTSARAYAGLAKGYAILSAYHDQPEAENMPKARAAAEQAIRIDPNSSEAHTALALVVQNYDWDWQISEKEYRRAIELNPNDATAHHWYAEHLMWQGRFDEALEQSERAHELDPLSLIIAADNGAILYFSRKYDPSIEKLRSVLEMDPSFMRAHLLVAAYVEKGMFAEAMASNDSARATIGEGAYWTWNAYIHARAGQLTEARAAMERLNDINNKAPVDPMAFAQVYAGLGDKDEAVAWLGKAYARRSHGLTALKVDPEYDLLRGDPRFRDLLRRVGLE